MWIFSRNTLSLCFYLGIFGDGCRRIISRAALANLDITSFFPLFIRTFCSVPCIRIVCSVPAYVLQSCASCATIKPSSGMDGCFRPTANCGSAGKFEAVYQRQQP